MDKSSPTAHSSPTSTGNIYALKRESSLTPLNSLIDQFNDLSLCRGASNQPESSIENRIISEPNQKKLIDYQYLANKIQYKINKAIESPGKIERGLREAMVDENPEYIQAEQILDSLFIVINHSGLNSSTSFTYSTDTSIDVLIDIFINRYFDIRGDNISKGILGITHDTILDTPEFRPFHQTYHRRWCEQTLSTLLETIDIKKQLIKLIDNTPCCTKKQIPLIFFM